MESEFVSKLLATLASPAAPIEQALIDPLSERELKVLRLITAGLSNPQTADQLCISINTVRLSRKEKFTSVANYLKPVLEKAPQVKPVSVGFFAGKLDYGCLNLFQKLFVRIIIRAKEGDYRNWEAIRDWAKSLRSELENNS